MIWFKRCKENFVAGKAGRVRHCEPVIVRKTSTNCSRQGSQSAQCFSTSRRSISAKSSATNMVIVSGAQQDRSSFWGACHEEDAPAFEFVV